MPDRTQQPSAAASPRPRPRALAELGLQVSEPRAEELARRWVLALVAERPLAELPELALGELAARAPALCAQLVLAVQSDVELDRLSGERSSEGRGSAHADDLAAMLGAVSAHAAVASVEALRGVLWEALLEDLGRAAGARALTRQVADLADRLAYVCSRLLAVALESLVREGERPPSAGATVATPAPSATPAPGSRGGAVMIDELAEDPAAALAPVAGRAAEQPVASAVRTVSAARTDAERPLSWDESPPVPPRIGTPEIEIRDQRVEEGAAARIGSIVRRLQLFASDGQPFAVMLIEPMDIELLRGIPGELARVDGELGQMLERALGPAAVAPVDVTGEANPAQTRESPARYWVIAPRSDARAAVALSEKLVRAAGRISGARGLPLELAIGTAVCPQDGRDAAGLAAHADVDLYAARSAARFARGMRPSVDEPA